MARQYFEDGGVLDPQVVNSTALSATTIEALWPAAQFSYIPANSCSVGTTFEIKAFGTITFSTASTLIITPSIGTATGGATLGASAAVSCPVSVGPYVWFLHAMAVVRSVTSPNAAAGTMMLGGAFWTHGILANTSPGANLTVAFGGTSAAFDTTAGPASTTGGITIAKTLSVAGSVTPMAAVMQRIN
jgi:hypothetical protein